LERRGPFLQKADRFSFGLAKIVFQGYIDLSKRRVSVEDVKKCEEKYAKGKIVNSILRHVAELKDLV
jgi:hypothetical protein